MKPTPLFDCLIIGAGLAGLMAAQTLTQQGKRVQVIEQAPLVGGRLATQKRGQAVFDTGAQFFTVRTATFAHWVARWQRAGWVQEWCRGFADAQGTSLADGYPRYCGVGGMATLARGLAKGVRVQLGCRVEGVFPAGQQWHIQTTPQTFSARSVILTPPIPQAKALLQDLPLPPQLEQEVPYHACLALMVTLNGASGVPRPGALQLSHTPIRWLADNQQKGISPLPTLTIHATPAFSQTHWHTAEEVITDKLLEAAQPWLGAKVVHTTLRRWRYSGPRTALAESCLPLPGRETLILAGDIFAGPRVEGAALSGLAAANYCLGV